MSSYETGFINYYRCDHEGSPYEDQGAVEWEDEWSCMCNDRCPICGHEISPYDSEEIS